MEAVVIEGICHSLPESYVSNLLNTLMKSLQQLQLETKEEEVVAVSFLRILTKVIPILGEAITSDWQTHWMVFLPLLQVPSTAIQMTAHRCLLVMVTIEPSILENLVVDLLKELAAKIDRIESTQTLEVRVVAGNHG